MAALRYISVAWSKQVPEGHAAWEIVFGYLALARAELLLGTTILPI